MPIDIQVNGSEFKIKGHVGLLYLVQRITQEGLSKKYFRGRPFDSEGAWNFLEINILTLKMLEINNFSSSGKKINNLTLTC